MSLSHFRPESPFKWARPASVTWVSSSESNWRLLKSPQVGQSGVGHRETGTVQLLQVGEPAHLREDFIGPAIVQIDEDDVGEVIDPQPIDQPLRPPRLPGDGFWAWSHSVS